MLLVAYIKDKITHIEVIIILLLDFFLKRMSIAVLSLNFAPMPNQSCLSKVSKPHAILTEVQ